MKLSHVDEQGRARMVDVGAKADTERIAVARGRVTMKPETLALIRAGTVKKGDVLTVAQVAGIQAAKRTHELIPMCHPLLLTHIAVSLVPGEAGGEAWIEVDATVGSAGKTGVEMEALTAASVAALTVYDMCKAADRGMRITDLRLIHKSGRERQPLPSLCPDSGGRMSSRRDGNDLVDQSGTVIAVCTSEKKGTRKRNVERAELRPEWGIVGDAHAANWHRQVSLLAWESIEKMRALGLNVNTGSFAENITTRGLSLVDLPVGARLQLGEALVEVTQIGKVCHERCAIYYQAGDCVMPREGIFVRVHQGGRVQVGDAVEVLSLPETPVVPDTPHQAPCP